MFLQSKMTNSQTDTRFVFKLKTHKIKAKDIGAQTDTRFVFKLDKKHYKMKKHNLKPTQDLYLNGDIKSCKPLPSGSNRHKICI